MNPTPAPLVELVDELMSMSGAVAVVLAGSHAVGAGDTDSDWDLGVYYRGTIDLSRLAAARCSPPPGFMGTPDERRRLAPLQRSEGRCAVARPGHTRIWQSVLEYRKAGTQALLVIDVSDVFDSATLHVLVSEKLGFPGYYGMNWDAFNDCFGEWDSAPLPDVLRIVGGSLLATRLPREAKLLRECLEHLAPAHPGCRVEWAG